MSTFTVDGDDRLYFCLLLRARHTQVTVVPQPHREAQAHWVFGCGIDFVLKAQSCPAVVGSAHTPWLVFADFSKPESLAFGTPSLWRKSFATCFPLTPLHEFSHLFNIATAIHHDSFLSAPQMSTTPTNATTRRSARSSAVPTGADAGGGGTSSGNAQEPSTDDDLDEPEGDFTPIYTGRFVWSAKKATQPLVPYEELPFKKSDRAKLPALTVRWEFTGKFSLNRDEDIARGSLRVQASRYLVQHGVTAPECVVNFPEGVGKNRFVDIRVPLEQFSHLKDAPLVFNKSKLQRIFIGPAFPPNYLVIGVGNVPPYGADPITARQIALALRQFVAVHDIWISQVSYADDPTPPADTNRWVALVSVEMETGGGIDPNKFHAIPGYIRLLENDCILSYIGRLDWCTSCRSQAEYYHDFNSCPRQRCFNCGKMGHRIANCNEEVPAAYDGDDAMVVQQANEDANGANRLDYGTA